MQQSYRRSDIKMVDEKMIRPFQSSTITVYERYIVKIKYLFLETNAINRYVIPQHKQKRIP